jgi:F0F1-type ATP synthase epsilon subunit
MLTLHLTAADRVTDYANLRSVSLPATRGTWQVLPKHAEAFLALTGGSLVCVHEDGTRETIDIAGGAAHVAHDEITVIL